jgi:pyruvate/2-oxoglutarate dehydrogenase complex dihydrolipoamide dehydrogenase (E3) component
MVEIDHYDALILGSGQGGKLLAWHLARSSMRTAVVERRDIGGSCPNIACMPSKNEVWAARIAYLTQHAAQFGTITGPVTVDMAKVVQRKRDMVDREIAGHLEAYKASGAELIMGSGHFVAPKTLEVQSNNGGVRRLTGDKVFINVGSHAGDPGYSGPRGGTAANAYRGARPGLRTLAPHRAPRGLCRVGTGAGLSPLR